MVLIFLSGATTFMKKTILLTSLSFIAMASIALASEKDANDQSGKVEKTEPQAVSTVEGTLKNLEPSQEEGSAEKKEDKSLLSKAVDAVDNVADRATKATKSVINKTVEATKSAAHNVSDFVTGHEEKAESKKEDAKEEKSVKKEASKKDEKKHSPKKSEKKSHVDVKKAEELTEKLNKETSACDASEKDCYNKVVAAEVKNHAEHDHAKENMADEISKKGHDNVSDMKKDTTAVVTAPIAKESKKKS
jgi:hypothetical protein